MASRRDFLTPFRRPLDKGEGSVKLRPPYGLNESLFQSECTLCESKACVASCDEKIIVLCEEGTPVLDFSSSGCEFCDDCAEACEADVLSLENVHTSQQINASFRISTKGCVAHGGVICFSCKEPCLEDAILFNGMFNPVIDREKCTACGFCVSVCPVNAIEYTAFELVDSEEQVANG